MSTSLYPRRLRRLLVHDYREPEYYFVTVRMDPRTPAAGRIEAGVLLCNEIGNIINQIWREMAIQFPQTILDTHIIMPDHMHGLLVPNGEGRNVRDAVSLSHLIGWFKCRSSRAINAYLGTVGQQRWQSGYYERVLRTRQEIERVRQYIQTNPERTFARRAGRD